MYDAASQRLELVFNERTRVVGAAEVIRPLLEDYRLVITRIDNLQKSVTLLGHRKTNHRTEDCAQPRCSRRPQRDGRSSGPTECMSEQARRNPSHSGCETVHFSISHFVHLRRSSKEPWLTAMQVTHGACERKSSFTRGRDDFSARLHLTLSRSRAPTMLRTSRSANSLTVTDLSENLKPSLLGLSGLLPSLQTLFKTKVPPQSVRKKNVMVAHVSKSCLRAT